MSDCYIPVCASLRKLSSVHALYFILARNPSSAPTQSSSSTHRHRPLAFLAALAFRGTSRPRASSFAARPDTVPLFDQHEPLHSPQHEYSPPAINSADAFGKRQRRRFSQQLPITHREQVLAFPPFPASSSIPIPRHSSSSRPTRTPTITTAAANAGTMIHATHAAHAGGRTDDDLPRQRSPSPPPPTKASLKAWWNQFKFMQRAKAGAGGNGKELAPGFGYGYPAVKGMSVFSTYIPSLFSTFPCSLSLHSITRLFTLRLLRISHERESSCRTVHGTLHWSR